MCMSAMVFDGIWITWLDAQHLMTHVVLCHIKRKSFHHDFATLIPRVELASPRAAAATMASASITLAVTIFV